MQGLSPDDRPREKLLTHGARALGDNELVALVLGSGCRQRDALVVANELLAARGGLHGLVQAGCDDLSRVTGIGCACAGRHRQGWGVVWYGHGLASSCARPSRRRRS